VPHSPIRTIDEVLADEQVAARDMLVRVQHPLNESEGATLLGSPLKLSATPVKLERAPPLLGSDTAAVLSELGYNLETVEEWRRLNVVG